MMLGVWQMAAFRKFLVIFSGKQWLFRVLVPVFPVFCFFGVDWVLAGMFDSPSLRHLSRPVLLLHMFLWVTMCMRFQFLLEVVSSCMGAFQDILAAFSTDPNPLRFVVSDGILASRPSVVAVIPLTTGLGEGGEGKGVWPYKPISAFIVFLHLSCTCNVWTTRFEIDAYSGSSVSNACPAMLARNSSSVPQLGYRLRWVD